MRDGARTYAKASKHGAKEWYFFENWCWDCHHVMCSGCSKYWPPCFECPPVKELFKGNLTPCKYESSVHPMFNVQMTNFIVVYLMQLVSFSTNRSAATWNKHAKGQGHSSNNVQKAVNFNVPCYSFASILESFSVRLWYATTTIYGCYGCFQFRTTATKLHPMGLGSVDPKTLKQLDNSDCR